MFAYRKYAMSVYIEYNLLMVKSEISIYFQAIFHPTRFHCNVNIIWCFRVGWWILFLQFWWLCRNGKQTPMPGSLKYWNISRVRMRKYCAWWEGFFFRYSIAEDRHRFQSKQNISEKQRCAFGKWYLTVC